MALKQPLRLILTSNLEFLAFCPNAHLFSVVHIVAWATFDNFVRTGRKDPHVDLLTQVKRKLPLLHL